MRTAALLLTIALTAAAGANLVDMPMDSLNPEGYFTLHEDIGVPVVEVEGDRTFIRMNNVNGMGATFVSPIINFEIYTGGTVDATCPGATLEFDTRYFQAGGGEGGEQPYDDNWTMFDVILYDANEVSFTWVDAFDNPEPYGEWHHLSLDLADTGGAAGFDLSQISRMELSGYNTRWCWQDHIDTDSLVITPEPTTLGMFALGLFGVLRRRR